MFRRWHRIGAYLLILLGALHLSVTFFNYDSLTLSALWFASAGVAIALTGFLNVALARAGGRDAVLRGLVVAANTILAALFALALLVLREPQVYFGLLLSVWMTVAAWRLPRA